MASFDKVLTKVFGSSNERFLKSIRPIIAQINEFEPSIQALSDDELRAKTLEFKERVADAIKDARDKDDRKYTEQEILNEILPEAFAVVREASKRTTGMRHFDVQMIGGLVLHQGKIAEMRTGEGKTLETRALLTLLRENSCTKLPPETFCGVLTWFGVIHIVKKP